MIARALLAAALLAVAPGRAEDVLSPFSRLQSADEPADRILACRELSEPPHRGPRAYRALLSAISRDLSERVRLAAALAAISYPQPRTLEKIAAFLESEPGVDVRRKMLAALASEPSYTGNLEATRLIAASLAEDPNDEIRIEAASALSYRRDAVALEAVKRAAEKDESKKVRAAAHRATRDLMSPPKQKAPAPKSGAVFGKDTCPRGWGWCGCSGAIKLKPKCLTKEECKNLQSEMVLHNLVCLWDDENED